jgi:triosephosphate isomerase
MTRRPIVAGNWKMNLDLPSGRALAGAVRDHVGRGSPMDVAICPPAIYLFPMAKSIADTPILMGAQNCWHEPQGAFTGELSPSMVKETGCTFVILGHSERRHAIGPKDANGRVQGETDDMIAAKCKAAMAVGLVPIICVGETLEERDSGATEAVLARQVAGSLAGVDVTSAEAIVVAYEPVWAIGTGRTATPQQAQDVQHYLRGLLTGRFGSEVGEGIRIQYGGSVKPDNVVELMKCPDVDGALVGGASLNAADFLAIIDGTIQAKGLG